MSSRGSRAAKPPPKSIGTTKQEEEKMLKERNDQDRETDDLIIHAEVRETSGAKTVPAARQSRLAESDVTKVREALLTLRCGDSFLAHIISELKACFSGDERGVTTLRRWIGEGELQTFMHESRRTRLLGVFGPDEFWDLAGPNLEAEWQRAEPKRPLSVDELLEQLRKDRKLIGRQLDWPEVEERDGKDTAIPKPRSQRNIHELLRYLGVIVFRNEFDGRYYLETPSKVQEITDDTINSLWLKADALGLKSARDYFETVVMETARQDTRHPLKDYLETCELEWDGTPRLETLLINHAGAEDHPLVREFTRLTLMAAVARVFKPGIKFDQMLVLQSEEGTQKSSLLRMLAGNEYFDDCSTLGQSPKEMIEQTRGVWILEVPELDRAKRESETIKATLSRTVDRAALKYEKMATSVPRAFIMIGTTNKDTVSQSDTGARRFWPINVKRIDLKAIKTLRDQLWGEAVARWKADGANADALKLDEKFWASARELQRQKSTSNPIHDDIAAALDGRTGEVTTEALYALIGLGPDKRASRKSWHAEQIHEGAVQVGWAKKRLTDGEARPYGYVKERSPADEDGYQTEQHGRWGYAEGIGLVDNGFAILSSIDDTVVPFSKPRDWRRG